MSNLKDKKNIKTAIVIKTKTKSYVLKMQQIFLGVCYFVGVIGVGAALIFVAVGFITPTVTHSVITLASANAVTLTWTAPGDDNDIGRASQYDIRYATFPITAENFSSATAVANPPEPSAAGSTENFEVTGLEPNTLYYFALKTADEVPNWSAVSNLASKRTSSICGPEWSCTDWSACQNSLKIRICLDLNNCGTEANKPATQIDCISDQPLVPCQENWSCTAWADCVQNIQRRACTDQNSCGTTGNKPQETLECAVGGNERNLPQEHYLGVSPAKNRAPLVKVYNRDFSLKKEFYAYAQNFKLGVNVSLGDVDGDGLAEVVTGTGPLAAPQVRIFSPEGQAKYQFFAYPSSFRIGVSVAAGDLDGDGREEIITAPQARGGPQIRIFKYQPVKKNFAVYKQFFVYPTNFRLGLNLESVDLNLDGRAEIIVAPVSYGGPQVRVFTLDPVSGNLKLLSQFFAYAYNFRGGVNLATGDVDNDGLKEIITGPGQGGGPHVRIFDIKGRAKYQFFAASTLFRGGLDVASFDYDLDGAEEVLTGTYTAGAPGVKVYNFENRRFVEKKFFYVYERNFLGGIRLDGY